MGVKLAAVNAANVEKTLTDNQIDSLPDASTGFIVGVAVAIKKDIDVTALVRPKDDPFRIFFFHVSIFV